MNTDTEIHDLKQSIESLRRQLGFLRKEVAFGTRQFFHEPDTWLRDAYNSKKGERCFLLGCGPSLNKVDLTKLKHETVMACNGAVFIEDVKAEYFISVSHFFYKSYLETLKDVRCDRRFLPWHLAELDSDTPTSWMNTAEYAEYSTFSKEKPYAFSLDASQKIFLGGTVIFPALQILHFLGFEEVVLLGVDHDYGLNEKQDQAYTVESSELNAHFTSQYYKTPTSVHIDFPGMERGYTLAKNAFDKSGRRILNASPGSKLETYPQVDYDSLF